MNNSHPGFFIYICSSRTAAFNAGMNAVCDEMAINLLVIEFGGTANLPSSLIQIFRRILQVLQVKAGVCVWVIRFYGDFTSLNLHVTVCRMWRGWQPSSSGTITGRRRCWALQGRRRATSSSATHCMHSALEPTTGSTIITSTSASSSSTPRTNTSTSSLQTSANTPWYVISVHLIIHSLTDTDITYITWTYPNDTFPVAILIYFWQFLIGVKCAIL